MWIKSGISCSRAQNDEHSYRPGCHRERQHLCWRSPGFSRAPQVRCTEMSCLGWREEVGKSSNPHTPLGLSASGHCEREPIAAWVSSAYVYAVSPTFPKQGHHSHRKRVLVLSDSAATCTDQQKQIRRKNSRWKLLKSSFTLCHFCINSTLYQHCSWISTYNTCGKHIHLKPADQTSLLGGWWPNLSSNLSEKVSVTAFPAILLHDW